jgi:hypothetical protein
MAVDGRPQRALARADLLARQAPGVAADAADGQDPVALAQHALRRPVARAGHRERVARDAVGDDDAPQEHEGDEHVHRRPRPR